MKNSYILLRNNKESNALSIEELKEIGLKKTDLIWVECQSMDWRSPFEIPELRNLVSANNTNDIKNSSKKLALKEVPKREDLFKQQKEVKTLSDPDDIKNLEKYSHPELVRLPGPEKKKTDTPSNNSFAPGEINEEQPKNARQKVQRNKSTLTIQLPINVKKIALYTGFVLAGALLMLLIQHLENNTAVIKQQEMSQPEKNSSSTAIMPTALNKDSTNTPTNFEDPSLATENGSGSTQKAEKKPVKPKNNIPLITDAKPDTQDVSNNTAEKNTIPVTETNIKPVNIEDISSKIALKANDYTVGFFGGIKNLKLTLQNNSAYMLDKVAVELNYLNQNGKIIDTEKLYFQNVKAGGAPALDVDKSKRGVKVEYQVTHIECNAITSHQ